MPAINFFSISKIKVIFILMLFSIAHFAQASETQPSNEAILAVKKIRDQYHLIVSNENCVGDREDPFDLGPGMIRGPLKGQCLDSESNRPVALLQSSPQSFLLGNIRFANKWWFGEISREAVADVFFEIVEFKSPVSLVKTAHTQLRFAFKPEHSMRLTSQVVTQNEKATLDDLTVTFNAFGVHGVGFDILEGVRDSFGLVGKFISSYDRSIEEMIGDHSTVRQIRMNLTEEQKQIVFRQAVLHSQRMGYSTMYHTLHANCTTELFDMLDEAIPRGPDVYSFTRSYAPKFINKFGGIGVIEPLTSFNQSLATTSHIRDLTIEPSISALKERNLYGEEIEPLNIAMDNGKLAQTIVETFKSTVRKPGHPKSK